VFICGLCSFHKIQPPDSGSACRAARGKPCAIRWRTKSDFDLLIAATARTDDLTPATLNIRDFRNQRNSTTDFPERQSRNQNRTAFGWFITFRHRMDRRPVLVAALPKISQPRADRVSPGG